MIDWAPVPRDRRLSLLLDLGAMLAREVSLDAVLTTLGRRIAEALEADRATVYLVEADTGELRSHVADLPELPEIRLPRGKGVAGFVAERGEVVNVRDASRDPRFFGGVDAATGYVTRSLLAAPIRDPHAIRGVVQVLNKRDGAFTTEDEAFLLALAAQVAQALDATTLRAAHPEGPGVTLRGPINRIVGSSPALEEVYALVRRAASTDATVLLTGETGSGKGLFARAIHANSGREAKPLVTVDCTTLPAALVESELFGHERGAFTGADRRVIGKVEAAEGGTLFLDEIGELPAPMQAKLLRVLQERAFERVGGRETLRADVRVLAATHRDLGALVERGEFREDLYYRLRVVEVQVPPLRARGVGEIEVLARHFLDLYTRRHRRPTRGLGVTALRALVAHDWPGNVRELEHTIERAVVVAEGETIEAAHLGLLARAGVRSATRGNAVEIPLGLSLADVERRYLDATLAAKGGNVTQAADALGIGRNTLKRKRTPARRKRS